ncbi:hypothetical protein HYH02_011816 [Chlamydomonas schloesseri]|uniref:RRM domain-containing protein n=1 Tax=Chlamydomonas schloesseri TaxID=2026947 RepID=A0A835VZZ0_9CHLO|nr:hypothetical protein HYH02_011816 [Chlamydomonas schloesseri]|eukprot:KAG2435522.1 hypothetical protein HYH02_011816 [Chlamydomonas schloesseri]
MSAANKKRKLETPAGKGISRTPAAALKSAPVPDARFALDSDFSDDDGAGAGPGPSSAAAAKAAGAKRPASAVKAHKTAGKPAKKQQPAKLAAESDDAEADDGDQGTAAAVEVPHKNGAARRAGAAAAAAAAARRIGDVDVDIDDVVGADDAGLGASGGGGDDGADGEGTGDGEGCISDGDGDGEPLSGSGDGGDGERGSGKKTKKVLSKRKLQAVNEASDRRGIVYISRIPPHMKPHKLRQLLEPHGTLGRVYCAPEDPAARRLRKQKGGNSGKNFTEGWVEFEDKRRAKRAALALNGQPMGGSKRSAYYYDLWNIKYLPKFKWDTLTEEINYQRAVREQRLVAEISAAKRERDFYLSRVDKAKAIDAIKERRAKKEAAGGAGAAAGQGGGEAGAAKPAMEAGAVVPAEGGAAGGAGRGGPRFERHFGQRRVKADPVNDERAPVLASDVLTLFGKKR